jgi:TolB protein
MVAVDPKGGGDGDISPDGHKFVAASRRGGSWDIWLHDIERGESTQLTDGPGDENEPQWSQDGGRIVYTGTGSSSKSLYILSVADRSIRALTDGIDDEYPAWSYDGRSVIFTGGPWKVRDFYLISAEGGPIQKISKTTDRAAGACSFTPGDRAIICHRYDAGSGDVVELSVPGGEHRIVTRGPSYDYKPEYSPDGKWIAFSRWDEGPSHIWLVPAEGGRARRLTSGPHRDRWPTWDRSGTRLFFHRVVEEGGAIFVLSKATGEARKIVSAEEAPRQAAFDPSGKKLVYCARRDGQLVLRIRDLESGGMRELGGSTNERCFPRWSPDGRRLAYVTALGRRWHIAVSDLDGNEEKILTLRHAELRQMNHPIDWSPDGTSIVFKSETAPFESDLFLIDVESGELRRLTRDIWWDESPSFTPDGRGVLFMSTRGGGWTWGIFRLSLEDGKIEVLSSSDYVEKNYPRMHPSGEAVWSFFDDVGRESLLVRAQDGTATPMTERLGLARWPAYSPAGDIAYTSVERRVEYWLVENPLAADSPLWSPESLEAQDAGEIGLAMVDMGEPTPLLTRNPVDPFHR